jgi:CxxC motif-containing protein (DUF1111 family)
MIRLVMRQFGLGFSTLDLMGYQTSMIQLKHFMILTGLIFAANQTLPAQHQRLGLEGASVTERGRTLFEWVWEPTNLPRPIDRSDGLGPMFNGKSCAECHHQGGTGGGGIGLHNTEIITAWPVTDKTGHISTRQKLGEIHEGLKVSSSVILHKESLNSGYANYRQKVAGKHADFTIFLTQRNTPSLFGLGLVDQLNAKILLQQEAMQASLGLTGRVSRTDDGRVGKFGWKAQKASLKEFVEEAAAAELGLESRTKHQGSDPRKPVEPASTTDLSDEQLDAITAYVSSLPKPKSKLSKDEFPGQELFRQIGCQDCHVEKLGDISGIYSDLLLHDMKPELQEAGSYAIFGVSNPGKPVSTNDSVKASEWRTPPLWGVGSTPPYLHDGSAKCLEDAIADHGGEALESAKKFIQLNSDQRNELLKFLRSL